VDYRADLQRLTTALMNQATVLIAALGLSTDDLVRQLESKANVQLAMLKGLSEQGSAVREQIEDLAHSVQGGNDQVARLAGMMDQLLKRQGLGKQVGKLVL
jgi:hypothetical protein